MRAGDVVGHYQLLLPVGAGGMARVWAARRLGAPVQRLVAVKTALEEFAKDAEFDRLFVDEARIASQIQHPNVCGIYELASEKGIPYLVMEWSDGGTLRDLLDATPERRLDYGVSAKIVADACAGLHAAHELEDLEGAALHVVHRDVSPQNLLMSSTGHVKVADFGVAKAKGQIHRPTETGEVKGKLSYMAPEQVTSRDIDRRADIFALGCVLYECTLGVRPFHGVDALSTMYKILENPVEVPSERDPGYPAELEQIVLRSLAKDRAERYQTADEMRRDLERFLTSNCGGLVTETAIASAVTAALGGAIAARNARIEAVSRALDDGDSVEEPPESARLATLASVKAPESDPSSFSTTSQSPKEAASSSSRLLTAAIVIGVAVMGVAGLALLRPPEAPAPAVTTTTPKAALNATPERSKETPETVTVTVRVRPVDAMISVDGGPLQSNPFVGSFVRDGQAHKVRAVANGYEATEQTIFFDRSRDLHLELEVSSTAKKPPVRGSARPTSALKPTAEPGSDQREPGTLPKSAGKKPPRQLDSSNPF